MKSIRDAYLAALPYYRDQIEASAHTTGRPWLTDEDRERIERAYRTAFEMALRHEGISADAFFRIYALEHETDLAARRLEERDAPEAAAIRHATRVIGSGGQCGLAGFVRVVPLHDLTGEEGVRLLIRGEEPVDLALSDCSCALDVEALVERTIGALVERWSPRVEPAPEAEP